MPFTASSNNRDRTHLQLVLFSILPVGCMPSQPSPATHSVEQHLSAVHAGDPLDPSQPADQGRSASAAPWKRDKVIATVDGQLISSREFDELLIRSRGPAILEPLIVIAAAEKQAAKLGIAITPAMLDQEYELSLRQLLSSQPPGAHEQPLSAAERAQAERILANHLADRNTSRQEYDLAVRRNAVLRALARREVKSTPEAIEKEARLLDGPRIQVRHIQLASLRDVQTVQEKLKRGEPFDEVARQHSANLATASQGGLMPPFTSGDPQVPATIRQAAFALSEGAVSETVRVDPWYHLLRVEHRELPALTSDEARAEAKERLNERLLPEAMQSLYRSLLESADIRIRDPLLAELWRERSAASEGR